jgi:subtilase family serine protease
MHISWITRQRAHGAPQGRAAHRWRWAPVAVAAAASMVALTAASGSAAATGRPAKATVGATSAAADAGKTAISGTPGGVSCGPPRVLPLVLCYTPHEYQVAYGAASLISHGIDGRGETVVMPELANTPTHHGFTFTDIRKDLASFDTKYGLPPASLRVDNSIAHGRTPYLAGTEEVEDTEIAHAIAPGAALDVVLFPQSAIASPANLATALTEVVSAGIARGAAVVSISASLGEHYATPAEVARLHSALEQASEHHVTVVASSGDTGASSDPHFGPPVKEVSLPASDPLVLAAGGTSLDASYATGAYKGEMAWNSLTDATGGGYSHLFPRPSYQDGVPRIDDARGVPDVAADANDLTAMALAYYHGPNLPAQGTSAATPLWAAVIALADQEAGQHLGFVNPAIYQIARGDAYHRAFHDVVTGDNSIMLPSRVLVGYQAGPGWDPATGWGSPNAQVLVPLLAHASPGAAVGS